MKQSARVPLSGLMLVRVQERRLHEGQQQRHSHQDGSQPTHDTGLYITESRRSLAFSVHREETPGHLWIYPTHILNLDVI
jgi:hypothetical protein